MADSSFDQFTAGRSAGTWAWLRAHMWRMGAWSPYFDDETGSYANAWVYDDAYAIYSGEALAGQHPEWILRDPQGNRLYIPYACSGGTCPQYAADITNGAYRQYWIAHLRGELAHGYKGVFIDDVNMDMQVGDGNGHDVAPVDPATGRSMTSDAWRHYMAQFMVEIRAALPSGAEIVHNAIWFAADDAGTSNADIAAEISAADYINLERGVNDAGLTGGSGQWSLSAFLAYIDEIHDLGRGVILEGDASDPAGLEYNLAAYFLISTGNDAVSGAAQTPVNWFAGYDANLGAASGPRRLWDGVLRRDFTGGVVLVNPPDAKTVTIPLPGRMLDVSGKTVTSVILGPAAGAVLRNVAHVSGRLAPPSKSTHTVVYVRFARCKHCVALRVSGRVAAATRGTVTLHIEACLGGRWEQVKTARTKVDGRGRFTRLISIGSLKRYRVWAAYSGSHQLRPSRSTVAQLAP